MTSSSTARPSTRAAGRGLLLAAALLAAGVLGGCSSGSDANCNEIAGKICDKLDTCESMLTTFTTYEQCVDSFNGLFEVQVYDDSLCRQVWDESGDLDCEAFLDYFSM